MANKKKVLVITGTRAEYGLLHPVLEEIHKSKRLGLRLLVTGMHTQKTYGYTIDQIKKDKMPIAAVVPIDEKASMLEALSQEIIGIEKYAKKEKPDLILVDADRDEGFAGAIVAGHLGIPLAHIGGGDSSGMGVDEAIRHSISKFAHVHFPISVQSAKRLLKLGEDKSRIHMVGTAAFDLLAKTKLKSKIELASLYGFDAKQPWILFVQHPTPLDGVPPQKQILSSLSVLSRLPGQKIIIYPNSDTGADTFIGAIKKLAKMPNVRVFRSLPRDEYLALLRHSALMMGNSSSGIVEAGFFRTPVVDIGNRQKGRERGGNVLHAGYSEKEIFKAAGRALLPSFRQKAARIKNPYGSGNSAKRIVKVLENINFSDSFRFKQIKI